MEEGGCSRSLGWDKDLKKYYWQGWGPAGIGQETARVGSPAGTVGLDSSRCEWRPTPVLLPGESPWTRPGITRSWTRWTWLSTWQRQRPAADSLEQQQWVQRQSGTLICALRLLSVLRVFIWTVVLCARCPARSIHACAWQVKATIQS